MSSSSEEKGRSRKDGLFHIDIGSNVPCERVWYVKF
jgi:hypothetical protein